MEKFHDFFTGSLCLLKLCGLELEEVLDLRNQLVQVLMELLDEVFSDPHACQHSKELAKLLLLAVCLQDAELSDMCSRKLLDHRKSSQLSTGHAIVKVGIEDFE